MGWFGESRYERECREFHEQLDEVKRGIAEVNPQIEKLRRGEYGADECRRNQRGK